MLTMTQSAIDAINSMTPQDGGLRLSLLQETASGTSLQLEVAAEPRPQEQVVEADGARLFLKPEALAALDDMMLDTARDAGRVRFAIGHQP